MVGVTSTASPLDLDPLANYRIHGKLLLNRNILNRKKHHCTYDSSGSCFTLAGFRLECYGALFSQYSDIVRIALPT